MKTLFCISISLFIFFISTAQNLQLLRAFDGIKAHDQKYNVEGQVALLSDFSIYKGFNGIDVNTDRPGFSHLWYRNPNEDDIWLAFYHGKLYDKRLTVNYSLQERSRAIYVYKHVKQYILAHNKIYSTKHLVSKYDAYGEAGKSEVFMLSPPNKVERYFQVNYDAILQSVEPGVDNTQHVSGYSVTYSYIDFFGVPSR